MTTPVAVRPSYDVAVAPHLQTLNRWVRQKGLQAQDADDVVQETLLLALRHFDKFRFEASLSTWLCRIAINVIRGRLRRPAHCRTTFVDSDSLEVLAASDRRESALSAMIQNETKVRIRGAVSKLPAAYRTVVELRDLRGLSIQETAAQLSLSVPAVKSRHHRARFQLLSILARPETTPCALGALAI